MTTWGWVMIWLVLFAGTVVVYALIALRLYRKLIRVLDQAGQTAALMGDLGEALDRLEVSYTPPTPDLFASAELRQQWRETRRRNLVQRQRRKVIRRTETLKRWKDIPHTFDERIK